MYAPTCVSIYITRPDLDTTKVSADKTIPPKYIREGLIALPLILRNNPIIPITSRAIVSLGITIF